MKKYITLGLGIAFAVSSFESANAKPIHNNYAYSKIDQIQFEDSVATNDFIAQALLYGMKTIQTGGLAIEKTKNTRLKSAVQTMIDQHTKLNNELREMAKAKNIALSMTKPQGGLRPDGRVDSAPDNLRDTSRNQNQGEAGNSGSISKNTVGLKTLEEKDVTESVQQLKKLSGTAFDQTFINILAQDNQKMMELYQMGARSDDKSVRKFSGKALIMLKQQLKLINEVK